MKSLLLSLSMILLYAETMASEVKVFSFSSRVKDLANDYSCSATLIKYQGQCHLLTNNHCVENKERFYVNFLKPEKLNLFAKQLDFYSNQYAVSDDISPIPVSLKKVNHRLDLAVLNFTSERLQNECNKIEELSPSDYENAVSLELIKVFLATGFVNHDPIMKFTSGLDWGLGGFGATQIFHQYALGCGLYFWNASDIDIVPGMSGSPVVNTSGTFIGLASKYVDFQNSALLIPSPMILSVIKDEIEDMPEMDLGNFKNNYVSDAGNEHGGAGGTPSQGSLQSFRLPDEGVLINNEMILGFTSKNGVFGQYFYHQIDGRDEFQNKVNDPNYLLGLGLKGKMGAFITRAIEGYPDVKIRKTILERLDGFYYLESTDNSKAKPFNQHRAIFLLDPSASRGLKELSRATTVIMVNVDSKKKKISFESEDLNINFAVTYSTDYKKVFLTKDQMKLTCDNKHLLKLICHNETMEISLSANFTGKSRDLKYRLAYLGTNKASSFITYWYGAVLAAPNPEAWRNR